MHDIDRALFETETYGEFAGEVFGEAPPGQLEQSQEYALATELLEIGDEAELNQFMGKLLGTAVSAARNFAGTPTGQAVGGLLKQAAKDALPGVGSWLGNQAGTWATQRLGLETEGLSAEDRELQNAQAFVRFAHETAQRAAQAPAGTAPVVAARQAAGAAAQQHLPGLLRSAGAPAVGGRPAGGGSTGASEGRWIRRKGRIVLIGA